MGIKVFENTPDQDELMLGEDEETDELAAEDAVAALSQTEIESGVADPVECICVKWVALISNKNW